MTDKELVELAMQAQKMSYAPYSQFHVGAALLTTDGAVYLGCNIENSTFSPTICAERVAFFKAVSEGKRAFEAIAIVGGKNHGISPELCTPCGVCRQVMSEFCDSGFRVILLTVSGELLTYTLDQLLPLKFNIEL